MNLPPLGEVIAHHHLRAEKARGQNFILDMNINHRIAALAGDITQCDVIEIGAGPGGLTRALLAAGARTLHTLEADARFAPPLAAIAAAYPNLHNHQCDALHTDLRTLVPAPYKVVANLPYNIATALLTAWLDTGWGVGVEKESWTEEDLAGAWQPPFSGMVLMFQKEVAERIVAAPATSAYGRLSVWVQWLCAAQIVYELPPEAFTPAPKVHSAVVRLTPHATPIKTASPQALAQVLSVCFGQRRKMLRVSLKRLCSQPEQVLAEAEIDATARPETLSVAAFCKLATLIDLKGDNHEKPSSR